MDFEQLSNDYIDDYIAEAMLAREMEWFHYDVDRLNFTDMLETLPADAVEQREDLNRRLQEISVQMASVECVYGALKRRIRDTQGHAAAIERVRAKRDAAG